MARGAIAKTSLIDAIVAALPQSYVGESSGKYYFEMPENGEMVQVAISMTCPKTPLASGTKTIVPNSGGGMDFEAAETVATPVKAAEISDQEKEYITKLMKELGL